MPEIQGQKAEISFVIQVTKKDTGETFEVPMVGYVDADQPMKEQENVSDTLDSGA